MDLDLRAAVASLGAPASELDDVGQLSMVVTMEMFDYGVDVNVEAPPPSDVTDITDRMDEPAS